MDVWEVTAYAGNAAYRGICSHKKMPTEREIAVCALHSFHLTPSRVEIKAITMAELRQSMRDDPGYGLVMCSIHCPLRTARALQAQPTRVPLRLLTLPPQVSPLLPQAEAVPAQTVLPAQAELPQVEAA